MLAGAILIGWVARKSRAQERADKPGDVPAPADAVAPASAPSPPLELPQGGGPLEKPSESPVPPPIQPGQAGDAPKTDDPEKNARTFVERNRKEAQDELKKLKDEAERLRTRLGKVEAGIRRWEALLGALENSERNEPPRAVVPTSTVVPTAEHPTNLEAIPRAKSATVIRESVPATSPSAPAPR
jgi:hypothetical protein